MLAHWRILELAALLAESDGTLWKAVTSPKPKYTSTGMNYGLSQWAYLGAMGPDIPYMYNRTGINSADKMPQLNWLADCFHAKKSNVVVTQFLETLATRANSELKDATYAFILGFLCHMAGDIMLHPYINSFAGAGDKHSITHPSSGWVMGRYEAHRYFELQHDVYLARTVYGAPNLDDGPGDDNSNSWADFIVDIYNASLAISHGSSNSHRLLSGVLNELMWAGKDSYRETGKTSQLTVPDLVRAVDFLYASLAFGYNWAEGWLPDFAPNKAHLNFVQSPVRDRDYEKYLMAAAKLTIKFWKAAKTYWEACQKGHGVTSEDDKRVFLQTVLNFNLDTGYTIRVYSKVDRNFGSEGWRDEPTIHLRYDHSWALYHDLL